MGRGARARCFGPEPARGIHLRMVSRCSSLVALALVLGCGAKTALEVPERDADLDASFDGGRDGGTDAGSDTGADVPIDGCVPIERPLVPTRAEAMFVLDRSTSMGWALTGPDGSGATRFAILSEALAATLPRYDGAIDTGGLLYPSEGTDACTVDELPPLPPAPMGAGAVLRAVTSSFPGGRTPTAAALRSVERYFATHPEPSRARAVVLATDGAPNCNGALDSDRCACTGGAGLPAGTCSGEPELCLDDARSIALITSLADAGIPTYVVGIDGDPDPALRRVLTSLAVAGGRPNPRDPGLAYYPVNRREDLATALDRIQAAIVSCSLFFEGTILPDRPLLVSMDGVPLPRDPGRSEGWELAEDAAQTVVLYGEACLRAQDGEHTLTLTQPCG